MKKSELKQLIREVIEETEAANVNKMMAALKKNPEVAKKLMTKLPKQDNSLATEGFGSTTMKKLAMILLAAGISAGSVLKADTNSDISALMKSMDNMIHAGTNAVNIANGLTAEQSNQVQILQKKAIELGKQKMKSDGGTHEQRVNVYKAVNQIVQQAVANLLGKELAAKFNSKQEKGSWGVDREYVGVQALLAP